MKNTLFRKVLPTLITWPSVRIGIPLVLLLLGFSYSHADDNFGHRSLVGTWVTSATLSVIPPGFPADGKFDAIEIFNSDGTMSVVSQIPGVTIGSGVWKRTGQSHYTFTFTFYRPDPSSPEKMLPVQVNENVLIDSADAYHTTDVIMPLDASGNPLTICGGICAFPGTVQAKRYQFANFNQAQP